MFRSLSYDHPQGSSFVLSALPLLRLSASSFALFGVWHYIADTYIHTPNNANDKANKRRSGNTLSTKDVHMIMTEHVGFLMMFLQNIFKLF
jgi:hypothetical protein